MAFQRLPAALVNGATPLPPDIEAQVEKLVDEAYEDLTSQANTMYPQAYLAQLFKNQTKLAAITKAIAASKAPTAVSAVTC